jgi:hypothetical protein
MPSKGAIQKKGERERMRRLFGAISEDVHKALRLYAAEHDLEMQEVIEEAPRKFLGLKGGEKDKKWGNPPRNYPKELRPHVEITAIDN